MLAEVLQTDQTDVALHCHPQFRPLCLSPVCVVSLCVCRRFDHSRSVPPTHHSAFILLPSIILVPLRLHSSVALTALIPLFLSRTVAMAVFLFHLPPPILPFLIIDFYFPPFSVLRHSSLLFHHFRRAIYEIIDFQLLHPGIFTSFTHTKWL